MRDFEQDRKICDAATKGNYIVSKYEDNTLTVEIITCVGDDPNNGEWLNPTEHDAKFIYSARDGWPAALREIDRLRSMLSAVVAASSEKNMQLALAAEEAASGCCPYDRNKDAVGSFCDESCEIDEEKSEWCWQKYWQQQANVPRIGDKIKFLLFKRETVGVVANFIGSKLLIDVGGGEVEVKRENVIWESGSARIFGLTKEAQP